jgi:hypothetical protein
MTAPDRGTVTAKTPLHPRGRPHKVLGQAEVFDRKPADVNASVPPFGDAGRKVAEETVAQ